MKRKYDVHVCSCGRIHLVPIEKTDKAISKNKNLLFICSSCGAAKIIGADEEYDEFEPGKKCYMMYSCSFSPYKSASITTKSFYKNQKNKGISEIYYSHGVKVPMNNGFYATEYHNGRFYDGRVIFNLYEIDRPDVTAEEVQAFIKKAREDASTVNMDRFIRETEEKYLKAISCLYIEGFNWENTPYKHKYN